MIIVKTILFSVHFLALPSVTANTHQASENSYMISYHGSSLLVALALPFGPPGPGPYRAPTNPCYMYILVRQGAPPLEVHFARLGLRSTFGHAAAQSRPPDHLPPRVERLSMAKCSSSSSNGARVTKKAFHFPLQMKRRCFSYISTDFSSFIARCILVCPVEGGGGFGGSQGPVARGLVEHVVET